MSYGRNNHKKLARAKMKESMKNAKQIVCANCKATVFGQAFKLGHISAIMSAD